MDLESEEEVIGFPETITTSVQIHTTLPSTSKMSRYVEKKIKAELSPDEEEDLSGFSEELQRDQSEKQGIEDKASEKTLAPNSKNEDHGQLSQYTKKNVLKSFQKYGPGHFGLKYMERKFKPKQRKSIMDYVNKQAIKSQLNVKEECCQAGIMTEFANVESWIDVLLVRKLQNECKHELPSILRSIAETESHLEVHESGGIDFKRLYTFLSEVMLGQPSFIPDGPTAAFLEEVINELLEEVGNDSKSVEKIKNRLKKTTKGDSLVTLFQQSLDPLSLQDT